MKTELKKVYYCEFCKKHGLSASSISRHEKYCKMRPENRHKCFDTCANMKRDIDFINWPASARIKTIFTCGVTGVKMYSYLLEKRIEFNPEFIEGLTRMPVQCKDYRMMNESEYEARFNPSSDTDL